MGKRGGRRRKRQRRGQGTLKEVDVAAGRLWLTLEAFSKADREDAGDEDSEALHARLTRLTAPKNTPTDTLDVVVKRWMFASQDMLTWKDRSTLPTPRAVVRLLDIVAQHRPSSGLVRSVWAEAIHYCDNRLHDFVASTSAMPEEAEETRKAIKTLFEQALHLRQRPPGASTVCSLAHAFDMDFGRTLDFVVPCLTRAVAARDAERRFPSGHVERTALLLTLSYLVKIAGDRAYAVQCMETLVQHIGALPDDLRDHADTETPLAALRLMTAMSDDNNSDFTVEPADVNSLHFQAFAALLHLLACLKLHNVAHEMVKVRADLGLDESRRALCVSQLIAGASAARDTVGLNRAVLLAEELGTSLPTKGWGFCAHVAVADTALGPNGSDPRQYGSAHSGTKRPSHAQVVSEAGAVIDRLVELADVHGADFDRGDWLRFVRAYDSLGRPDDERPPLRRAGQNTHRSPVARRFEQLLRQAPRAARQVRRQGSTGELRPKETQDFISAFRACVTDPALSSQEISAAVGRWVNQSGASARQRSEGLAMVDALTLVAKQLRWAKRRLTTPVWIKIVHLVREVNKTVKEELEMERPPFIRMCSMAFEDGAVLSRELAAGTIAYYGRKGELTGLHRVVLNLAGKLGHWWNGFNVGFAVSSVLHILSSDTSRNLTKSITILRDLEAAMPADHVDAEEVKTVRRILEAWPRPPTANLAYDSLAPGNVRGILAACVAQGHRGVRLAETVIAARPDLAAQGYMIPMYTRLYDIRRLRAAFERMYRDGGVLEDPVWFYTLRALMRPLNIPLTSAEAQDAASAHRARRARGRQMLAVLVQNMPSRTRHQLATNDRMRVLVMQAFISTHPDGSGPEAEHAAVRAVRYLIENSAEAVAASTPSATAVAESASAAAT